MREAVLLREVRGRGILFVVGLGALTGVPRAELGVDLDAGVAVPFALVGGEVVTVGRMLGRLPAGGLLGLGCVEADADKVRFAGESRATPALSLLRPWSLKFSGNPVTKSPSPSCL